MAATCYCRLACDLTCMMVGTFCFPGLNDLNNGRCRYRVTTWTQSTWIRWNHVGSIGLFSQRTSRNVNASAKQRKPCMCMHHWSLHLPAYRRCVKCWQLKSMVFYIHAENDFSTLFDILLSTTNFLLEHKMQHTSWVPVQKHKSSYTNWFWWWTVNKQKSFQQCDYVYKNQRISFVELDNLLFITALLAMSIIKHTNHDRFMESLFLMFFGPLVLKFAGEHHTGFCWIVLDYNMNNICVLIRLKTNLTYANSQSNLRWSCVLAHRWLQLLAIGLELLLIEKNDWAHPLDNDMCSSQSGLDIFSVIWVHDVLGMCISHIYKHCICLSLL